MNDLTPFLKFNSANGMKPSAEARRYVYRCLDAILANAENDEGDDLFFGGVEVDADIRRLRIAIKKVRAEMQRKAASKT